MDFELPSLRYGHWFWSLKKPTTVSYGDNMQFKVDTNLKNKFVISFKLRF